MEFSNHCHIRAMTKDDSSSSDIDEYQSHLSSAIWRGGMVNSISTMNELPFYISKPQAHHHHSETTPASRCVPFSKQWFMDTNAPYASFSSHTDIQDLLKTSCLLDCLSTNHTFEYLGNASYPLALIAFVISHLNGTSLSSTEGASDRDSVSHDVLFSTMCISDYSDRVPFYPISGHILFDTLFEESLKDKQILSMIGKDDSGQIQSDDASCDESAQKSRNGGLVASATSPKKSMFYFFTYTGTDKMRTDTRQDSFSFVKQLDVTMSDTKDTLVPVPQAVRDLAGAYAKRRGMAKGTVNRYEAGGADEEPLLQVLAKTYAAGQSDPVLSSAEATLEIEVTQLKSIIAENKDYFNKMVQNFTDNKTEFLVEIEELKKQLIEQESELSKLKLEQQNDTIAANEKLTKLVKQLVEAQTVIYDVRERLKGSFFSKVSAIKELVSKIDISNRP